MNASSGRVAVVGAGVAGLAAALELGRAGLGVDLYSLLPAASSPSTSERDGIGAAEPGDAPAIERHLLDSVVAGAYLAHQPPLRAMIESAPALLDELLRLGVPFARDADGSPKRDRLGGASIARAAHAGVHTGRHVLRVLDAQLLRLEAEAPPRASEPLIRRYERCDFVRLVLDDAGRAVGLVAQDRVSLRHSARPYAAVLLATGGAFAHFARSAASLVSHGSAAAAVFRQGAIYANADLVEEHPTTVLVRGRRRIVAELCRSRGARLWVPRDPKDARPPESIPEAERCFLPEQALGKLVDLGARDRLTRALRDALDRGEPGARSDADDRAYLDLAGVERSLLDVELGELLPAHRQLRVGPAVSGAMGGLWVDYEADENGRLIEASPRNQATSIAGLYAAGEVDFQLHGAARLGENRLLGCLFQGRLAAQAIVAYARALAPSVEALSAVLFERHAREADEEHAALAAKNDDSVDVFESCDALRRCAQRALEADGDLELLAACAEELEVLDERARELGSVGSAIGSGSPRLRELRAMSLHARLFVRSRLARLEAVADDPGTSAASRLVLARSAANDGIELVGAFEHTVAGTSLLVDASIDRRFVEAAIGGTAEPQESSGEERKP
jgi:succinate dehydrogenase / fumarate reductase, flavoprotein subunit